MALQNENFSPVTPLPAGAFTGLEAWGGGRRSISRSTLATVSNNSLRCPTTASARLPGKEPMNDGARCQSRPCSASIAAATPLRDVTSKACSGWRKAADTRAFRS